MEKSGTVIRHDISAKKRPQTYVVKSLINVENKNGRPFSVDNVDNCGFISDNKLKILWKLLFRSDSFHQSV